MDWTTMQTFRHDISGCFGHAKDVLFNTVDALLTEDRALVPRMVVVAQRMTRRWPGVYEGLEDGSINASRVREVFARLLPPSMQKQVRWVGMARPRSRTSAERSARHVHHLPECKKPLTSGWQCSTVVALPSTPRNWTYALSAQRVSTETTPARVALEQMTHLLPLVPQDTISVLDRGSDSTWFWCPCNVLPHKGTLIRVKSHRCVSRPAPARTGTRGGPRNDGDTRRPDTPASHGSPDGQWDALMRKRDPSACAGGSPCLSQRLALWT